MNECEYFVKTAQIDGKTVNGYVTKNGVTINVNSAKSLNSVVGHEITHVLEGTQLYSEMQKALFEYAKTKKDLDGRRKTIEELYKDEKDADVDAELTADLVGDYLFTDADFINNLSTENRNLFQKIFDEIKYLCKVATAGSKEARQLEEVKRKFEKAYKESSKGTTDTKYSINKEFNDEIDRWDKKTTGFSFVVGETSIALQEAGIPKKQIRWDASKITTLLNKHSGMTIDVVKQIPNLLENPIIVIDSKQNSNSKIVMGDLYDTNGKIVTAVLLLTPTSKKGNVLDLIKISSAEGRGHIKSLFTKEDGSNVAVRYVDKKRIQSWLNANRLQLPLHNLDLDSKYSISQNSEKSIGNQKNSLSAENFDIAPIGNYNVKGEEIALDIGPVREDIVKSTDGRTILYALNGKTKKVGNAQVNSLKIKGSGQNSNSADIISQNHETSSYNTKFPNVNNLDYSSINALNPLF